MSKIRRTLVIGLGERGTRIGRLARRQVQALAGELPILRYVQIGAIGQVDPQTGGLVLKLPTGLDPDSIDAWQQAFAAAEAELGGLLNEELLAAHRLAHDRAAARQGWPAAETGAAVYLIADLGDPLAAAGFVPAAELARAAAERRAPGGAGLCGVGLLPDGAVDEETGPPATARSALRALDRVQSSRLLPDLAWRGLDETSGRPVLFNEGCYLLAPVNEHGLAADDDAALEEMVAGWLAEMLLTPLAAMLERHTPLEGCGDYGSFGLAGWSFPAAELAGHLAGRLKREMTQALLSPPEGDLDPPTIPAPPAPWSDEPRLALSVEQFLPLDPSRISSLRQSIDGAARSALAALHAAVEGCDAHLARAAGMGMLALQIERNARLNEPGGGLEAARRYWQAVDRDCQAHAAAAAARAAGVRERMTGLEAALEQDAAMLDSHIARFPPWRWRAWLPFLLCPWRLPGLWLVYHRAGEQAAAYLASYQVRWRLESEALEADWQVGYYQELIAGVAEERARLQRLLDGIGDLCRRFSAAPTLSDAQIGALLQANALPQGLDGYYYRKTDPERAVDAFLTTHGPLSRWLEEELSAATLERMLDEYAGEWFSFLYDQVRFDELLARTYTGQELKAYLHELVTAACPFWAGDDALLAPDERAVAAPCVLIGLPEPGSSPLGALIAELWPEAVLYAGAGPHRITALQVRRGLPRYTLKIWSDIETACPDGVYAAGDTDEEEHDDQANVE